MSCSGRRSASLPSPRRPAPSAASPCPTSATRRGSEHLDTLARLVRANAAVLLEGVTAQHERDGRGWKAEWAALPEACLLTSAALHIAIGVLGGLEVHAGAMAANLDRHGGYSASERALAALAPRLGKHRAQAELGAALAAGAAEGLTAAQALVAAGLFTPEEAAGLTAQPDPGACPDMVDLVVRRARAARAAEPQVWP